MVKGVTAEDVDLPYCTLFPALEIPEVDDCHNHVPSAFRVPDGEEFDVAVTHCPRRGVIANVLRQVAPKLGEV